MSADPTDDDRTIADSRTRIIRAAAVLIGDGGAAAVTTRAVAARAGVQAPTIYRLFGDKDGLLEAVAEDAMATHVAAKRDTVREASAAGADPVEDLRRGWRDQIDFGLANPALFRLLSDPDRSARSEASAAGLRVLASRMNRVARAGLLRVSEARAVAIMHAAGLGAVQSSLALPAELRSPGVFEDMLEAVLGRILVEGSAGDGQADEGRAGEAQSGVGERGSDVQSDPDAESRTAAVVALRAHASGLPFLSSSEQTLLVEWLDRPGAAG
ncbi:TetR/AcrR family transcriptional regulator [Herbiconiux solani]|uniref:TetR/AcrR family transcriptional regulator n=1 Tax=Herbiconiux solani TaxID=661329 RepID=UPI00082584F9|nr:TetR/AcrR family transcriptional regulator [Herbiconiux solani]